MNCSRTKELLSEYIDGLLDKEQEARVKDHLLLCGDCRDEFESMKAVVREMGSLDKINAPDDFLAALHGRMERESWFQKVKNFLFMPARIRIPVELATLATAVVVGFFIFHIVPPVPVSKTTPSKSQAVLKDKKPEPEIRSSGGAPASGSGIKPPEQVVMTDKIMTAPPKKEKSLPLPELPAVKTFKSEETDHIQGYGKTQTAVQPAKIREPLQVLLLLEPVGEKENLSPGIKEDAKLYSEKQTKKETAVPAPVRLQALTKAGAAEVMSRDETPPAGKSYEAKDNTILYKEGLLENIGEHIKNAGGTLIKTDINNETGQPEYLLIEIPGHNYMKFIENLSEFGKVQTPFAGDLSQSGESVNVRIRIISPN